MRLAASSDWQPGWRVIRRVLARHARPTERVRGDERAVGRVPVWRVGAGWPNQSINAIASGAERVLERPYSVRRSNCFPSYSNTATEQHRSVPNGTDDFRSARESRPPPPLHSLFRLHVSRSSKSSCPHQVTFFEKARTQGARAGAPPTDRQRTCGLIRLAWNFARRRPGLFPTLA